MTAEDAGQPKEAVPPMPGGRLAQGTPGLDISRAARDAGLVRMCGAAPRRGRAWPCRKLAMANGRCELHGGRSTGPRTPAGLERARRAGWKHGERSAMARAERRAMRELLRVGSELLAAVDEGPLPPELAAELRDRQWWALAVLTPRPDSTSTAEQDPIGE